MSRHRSTESTAAFRNPGKGWLNYNFRPVDRGSGGGPSWLYNSPYSSTHYTNYLLWSDVEPTQGVYDWTHLDAFIQYGADRNIRTSFGIAGPNTPARMGGQEPYPAWLRGLLPFTTPSEPSTLEPEYYNATFLARHQALWNAIAARYYKTTLGPTEPDWQRWVESIDISSYGNFGEWHSHFPWRKEQASISPYPGTASNLPITFRFDSLQLFNLTTGETLAGDGFNRTSAVGWTNAPQGGFYTGIEGDTDLSITSGEGRIVLDTAATGKRVGWKAQTAHNVEVRAKWAIDKVPTGSTIVLTAYLRSYTTLSNTEYTGRVLIPVAGNMTVQGLKNVGGVETSLGAAVSAGVAPVAGTFYHLRVQADGSSPTTVRVKCWQDGTAEPGWQFTATDSEASLQGPDYGEEQYNTLKTMIDHHFDAFEAARGANPMPTLSMNGIGSSLTGTTPYEKDESAVLYAMGRGAAVTRRGMGMSTHSYPADEDQIMEQVSATKPLSGEWFGGQWGGTIVAWKHASYPTIRYTRHGVDDNLERRASFAGWYKDNDGGSINCANIVGYEGLLDIDEVPELAQCVVFGGANGSSTMNPAIWPLRDRIYPDTSESLEVYAQKRLGYRFYVEDHEYPHTVTRGGAFNLKQRWYQRAVAKLHRQHYIRTRLVGLQRETVDETLDTDGSSFTAHAWEVGEIGPRLTISSFTVPADAAPGWYQLQFAVVNDDGEPAMNLAIDGKVTTGLSDATNSYSWYAIGAMKVT